jgi:hypothetical protein
MISDPTMASQSKNPISADEVLQVFSDRAVARLATKVGLPKGTDTQRLAKGIRASAQQYALDADRPTPNMMRREIDMLQRAADGRKYEKVARLRAELSGPTRELLERRAANIRSRSSSQDEQTAWSIQKPEQLHDCASRNDACDMVYSLAVTGGYPVKGRRRPTGKQYAKLQVRLYAPEPSRAEPRREAERTFVMWLRAGYCDATDRMPPNTAHHYRPGPFARMIGECLRLARVPTTNTDDDRVGLAVQLINDFDRERRLDELIRKWRRILDPLWHDDAAMTQVPRLIEAGKAVVRRISRGADDGAIADQPSLIEFEETGTLCFYLSPKERRTLSIKPFPRARIMQIAEALFAATSKKRLPARRRQKRA